jgi:hypothetical protein
MAVSTARTSIVAVGVCTKLMPIARSVVSLLSVPVIGRIAVMDHSQAAPGGDGTWLERSAVLVCVYGPGRPRATW